MRVYKFKPFSRPVLTEWAIREILEAKGKGLKSLKLSLDLGLSKSEVRIHGDRVAIGGIEIGLDELELALDLTKNGGIVEVTNDGIVKLAFYSGGNYYKLKAVAPLTAPTLEINGIHMHRIKGITPLEDSLLKVRTVRVRGGFRVLDVCTGLGYTAICSLKRGASEVVSIEKDINVLEIARHNPWSKELSEVKILLGNATELIKELEEERFEVVILDPPRYSMAPELYTSAFYADLFNVLKPGGRLFHYTGEPGSRRRGIDLMRSVSKRLRTVGFKVKKLRDLKGVLAFKPRW